MQLWLQLLSGQIPPGAEVVGGGHPEPAEGGSSSGSKFTRINIRGAEDQWEAELSVNPATGALSRISVTERTGLSAVIQLEPPRKWAPESIDDWIRLTDLPGERLDLR